MVADCRASSSHDAAYMRSLRHALGSKLPVRTRRYAPAHNTAKTKTPGIDGQDTLSIRDTAGTRDVGTERDGNGSRHAS